MDADVDPADFLAAGVDLAVDLVADGLDADGLDAADDALGFLAAGDDLELGLLAGLEAVFDAEDFWAAAPDFEVELPDVDLPLAVFDDDDLLGADFEAGLLATGFFAAGFFAVLAIFSSPKRELHEHNDDTSKTRDLE